MFKYVVTIACLAAIFHIALCSYQDFDDFYKYVEEYINYTTYYTLPTDNSEYESSNSTINDFGTYDFIIVGGGSAGSVLANRLSEVTSWKILLLETGETEDNFTAIPAMNYYLRSSPMNWGYYTKAQENSCQGMVDHKCVYPLGKVLGGSGVLGDMVYARGSKVNFDNWAIKANSSSWSYDEILPYFKKSEQIQISTYDSGYHGLNGSLYINYTNPKPVNFDNFLNGAKACGLEEIDYNGESQMGISKIQWTIDFNKRLTGGSAFVLPILSNRTNLTVSLKSFVTKILINSNNTAVGVQFIKGGKIYNATASKEVLLSAGAVNSPQILMLSGVGPKDVLEYFDIEVKNELPVGKYLTDHPAYIAMYVRTNNSAESSNLTVNLKKYINGETPFTSVFAAEPVMFWNTKTSSAVEPNLEVIMINPPLSVPTDPAMFYNFDTDYVNMFSELNTLTDHAIYIVNLQPKSRGNVTLQSNSPFDFPVVDPRYYTDSDDEDIEVIYEGIQFIQQMIATPPLQSINATIISYAPGCEDLKATSEKDYWYCAIKKVTSTLYHPTGTTRMGVYENDSVVDSNLKVHNMTGLRVIDAGVIPEIVTGHPFAAIFMMAEKISDVIKTDYNESAYITTKK